MQIQAPDPSTARSYLIRFYKIFFYLLENYSVAENRKIADRKDFLGLFIDHCLTEASTPLFYVKLNTNPVLEISSS